MSYMSEVWFWCYGFGVMGLGTTRANLNLISTYLFAGTLARATRTLAAQKKPGLRKLESHKEPPKAF